MFTKYPPRHQPGEDHHFPLLPHNQHLVPHPQYQELYLLLPAYAIDNRDDHSLPSSTSTVDSQVYLLILSLSFSSNSMNKINLFTPQSHYRVVKWNLIFFNFERLIHVINKKYEADVILYSHKKFQPNPCTFARARSKNLKFPLLN